MNRLNTPGGTTKPGSMAAPPPSAGGGGLARYGSAPGSFLAAIADSVTGAGAGDLAPVGSMGRFFSGESSGLTSCDSSCQTDRHDPSRPSRAGLERAYGGAGGIHVAAVGPGDGAGPHGSGSGGSGAAPLFRHSSSPAGLLSRLMADHHGMVATRGIGSYSQASTDAVNAMANRRLSSQWSFSRQDLPQISEMGVIPDMGESITGCNSSNEGTGHGAQSYLSRNFSMSSWDDTNSIMFSSPSKKAKESSDDIVTSLSNIESQFGLSKSSLEMSNMDEYFQMHQDSITCRVRAKRGCATHPRSIAERERRTRISKRLKKLQDLVPNMDKQTNTSDMLDLAVHYIKELQSQVEKLKQDQANCTCSGNNN